MATAPKYPQTLRSTTVAFNTANTNTDGTTGTYADAFVGTANGSVAMIVRLAATGSTSQDVVRIWLYDGTNATLLGEIFVPVMASPSITVPVFKASWSPPNGLVNLTATTMKIRLSTHVGNTYRATTEGADY